MDWNKCVRLLKVKENAVIKNQGNGAREERMEIEIDQRFEIECEF